MLLDHLEGAPRPDRIDFLAWHAISMPADDVNATPIDHQNENDTRVWPRGPTALLVAPGPHSVAVVDIEVLKRAVLLACRAPSVHNSQPWRWVADVGAGQTLHLHVDRSRTVPATDHSGREAILSCGAVLDHLRIAMSAARYETNISRFPDPNDPGHLATLEFSPLDSVTEAQQNRARAILQRRTDRLPFHPPAEWHLFEPVLRSVFDEDVVMLDVLSDDQRPRLVEASELSEALRRDDSSYHVELDWWTSSFSLAQGLPPSALLSVSERRRVEIARDFPIRSQQDRRSEIAADWSKILVLSTPDDTRDDVLRCGEVLSTRPHRVHNGGHGDVHADTSHRIRGEPRPRRRSDRPARRATSLDPRRHRAPVGKPARADTETTARQRLADSPNARERLSHGR